MTKPPSYRSSLLMLHLAVFLFGLSGLVGKMTTLPASVIVFGRTFLAALVLLALVKFGAPRLPATARDRSLLAVLGLLLALHWVTFFHAIRISSVAVGLLAVSSFPIFVTIIEPLWFKERLRLRDLVATVAVCVGLVLVIPEFTFENSATQGVIWGTISGFLFAVLSLLNRSLTRRHSAQYIALWQNGCAALVLLVPSFVQSFQWQLRDLWLLLFLGVVCTAGAHTLFIQSLKIIRAQTASILAALEPVYGIIVAYLVLSETPSVRTLIGGAIILATTVVVGSEGRHHGE